MQIRQRFPRLYLHRYLLEPRKSYDKSKSFGTEVITKAGYMRFILADNGVNVTSNSNSNIGGRLVYRPI